MAAFPGSSEPISAEQCCLFCHEPMRLSTGIRELLVTDDVICRKCRSQLIAWPKRIRVRGMRVDGIYPYQDQLREMMIQFKEYHDEALYPIFLYPYRKQIQSRYRGYKIACIPSSSSMNRKRGFVPVEKMASLLEMETVDIFRKSGDVESKTLKYRNREQIRDYIELINKKFIKNEKILLIDDIITTGATMKAACDLIRDDCRDVRALAISYNHRFLSRADRAVMSLLY